MKSAIVDKIKTYDELEIICNQARTAGKKIVFAVGTFDLTHLGHMLFFEQVKQYGDIAIIGVGSDDTIRSLKGAERPILSESVRVGTVASCMFVDYAVILHEDLKPNKDNHSDLVGRIRPDVYVLNDDDSAIDAKRVVIENVGGTLVLVPRELPEGFEPISTTAILGKIKNLLS